MFSRSANSDGIVADILSGGDNRQMAVLLATLVLAVVLGVILRRDPSGASSTNGSESKPSRRKFSKRHPAVDLGDGETALRRFVRS